MDDATVDDNSNQQEQSKQLSDIVTIKDDDAVIVIDVDKNQKTENSETLALTECSKPSGASSSLVTENGASLAEHNQVIIDQENQKCGSLQDESLNNSDSVTCEAKSNQENVITGITVSEEGPEDNDKNISLTSAKSSDDASEVVSKECTDKKDKSNNLESLSNGVNIDHVMEDDPKETLAEGIHLEKETDSIRESNREKQDEKMEQIEPTTVLQKETTPCTIKATVPVTQETTSDVSSSIDKRESAVGPEYNHQPTETESSKDEQVVTTPSSSSTWYTNGAEDNESKQEGYSATVVGGNAVRKPLPSRGSKFKMSLGSIFGRRKSQKDKTDVEQTDQGVNERQRDDGRKKMEDEKSVETEEARKSEIDEKKSTQGEIVPLEEGVAKSDIEVPEKKEELPEEPPIDEDSKLRERIAKRESMSPSNSPEKHMQMRVSYAEGSTGDKEVEVIGTREVVRPEQSIKSNVPPNYKYSCRELGEVDHEGWLVKRGGTSIFATWKRKWVVLKERHLYYYKTSFDLEAGGVVTLDETNLAAPAPEVKRKFTFKVDSDTNKAHKIYFAADNQADMDKWLAVLSAASRGEMIVRKTNSLSTSDVKMRKKTSSISKRCGSVLGIGGLYDYDGNLEKASPTRRRASFGSSPQENHKSLSFSAIVVKEDEPQEDQPQKDQAPADQAQKDQPPVDQAQKDQPPVDQPQKDQPLVDQPQKELPQEPSAKKIIAHESLKNEINTTTEVDSQANMEIGKVEEELPREISSTIECNKVDEVHMNPLERDLVESEALKTAADEIKAGQSSPPPSSSSPNNEDECPNIAPLHDVIIDENKKDENVSQTQTIQDVSQLEEQTEDKEACIKTPSSQKTSSNTTWYLILDVKNDSWVEYINKPKNNDDELLSLVRTIKDARITITGTPLPGNEERVRAMTNVSSQNAEVLRLRELRRTLKDKERDLQAMDELLSQDVNRQSISEWTARYPCLKEELTGEPIQDDDLNTNDVTTTPQEQLNSDRDIPNSETIESEDLPEAINEADKGKVLDEKRREDVEDEEVKKKKRENQEDTQEEAAGVNNGDVESRQKANVNSDNIVETSEKNETKDQNESETLPTYHDMTNEIPDAEDVLDTKL